MMFLPPKPWHGDKWLDGKGIGYVNGYIKTYARVAGTLA